MSEEEQALINEFLKNNTITKCPDVYECVIEHEFSPPKKKGQKTINQKAYDKGAKYLDEHFKQEMEYEIILYEIKEALCSIFNESAN